MQLPGVAKWTNHVVPPVDDDRWNVGNPSRVLDELIWPVEETVVDEVVVFDAGERKIHLVAAFLHIRP